MAVFALGLVTVLVFWPLAGHEFLNYDDTLYVTQNEQVRAGLSLAGLRWAFGSVQASNWHPLTWLSHMTDVTLFGLHAGPHHLVSLGLHLINAALLMTLLQGLTGTFWRAAIVAVLFAVHPLHVESVAWISERKDVLSTTFWLLTMLAYRRYVRKPGILPFLPVFLFDALGLMAKPMLVTLPLVLLLADYWPLGRLGKTGPTEEGRTPAPAARVSWQALLLEKTPLLALSGLSGCVTYFAQAGDAVKSFAVYPLSVRLGNALLSYAGYVMKTLAPLKLAVFYPHPGSGLSWPRVLVSAVFLLFITWLATAQRGKRPFLMFGWFWFLGTLAPVIGLIQVGGQAMADRYTYIPLVGLFIAVVWAVSELATHAAGGRSPAYLSVALLLSAMAILAGRQVLYWKDSTTLFRHALAVTEGNYLAHSGLGVVLDEQGKTEEAIANFREALKIAPGYVDALYNLGNALFRQGRADEAAAYYSRLMEISPNIAPAHGNMGELLAKQREQQAAAAEVQSGNRLSSEGKRREAMAQYQKALSRNPDLVEAHTKLGLLLAAEENISEALAHFENAVEIKPDLVIARYNLAALLARQGRLEEAAGHYRKVLAIDPDNALAHFSMGNLLSISKEFRGAADHYREALRINPDNQDARRNLESVQRQSRD